MVSVLIRIQLRLHFGAFVVLWSAIRRSINTGSAKKDMGFISYLQGTLSRSRCHLLGGDIPRYISAWDVPAKPIMEWPKLGARASLIHPLSIPRSP